MVIDFKIEGHEDFKDLVRVSGADEDLAVSMRELHRLLGIKKGFTDWFKNQQERMSLVEGIDFITLMGESTGGRLSVDYIVSLNDAKHLCMASQSDTAHKIRQYFIDFEREWNNPISVINRAIEMSPEIFMATALQIANDVIQKHQKHVDELEAKMLN